MNILFLSQVLPYPLDAGPKLRSYYVLRYLSQRHAITLVTFVRPQDDPHAVEHLKTFCRAVYTVPIKRSALREPIFFLHSLATRKPYLILRDDLANMRKCLAQLLAQETFDAVHADQLAMAHYALRVPQMFRVLDQHNAVWTIVQRLCQNEPAPLKRLVLGLEWRKLRHYEAAIIPRFDQVLTVTDQDKRALTFSDQVLAHPMVTIPICIDPPSVPVITPNPDAHDVTCVGGMFYPPNVDGMLWFAREVLPLLWRSHPETKFYVVGARPDERLLHLAQQESRVIVTGYVSDPSEYLSKAAAFVVPLRAGGGMRVKILDAWARGLPVISTTIGCEGIEVCPGDNILLADSPSDFATAVACLIKDRALAAHLAQSGRRWVEQRYNWRTVYKRFDDIYPVPS